jgi:hypothetical protein
VTAVMQPQLTLVSDAFAPQSRGMAAKRCSDDGYRRQSTEEKQRTKMMAYSVVR